MNPMPRETKQACCTSVEVKKHAFVASLLFRHNRVFSYAVIGNSTPEDAAGTGGSKRKRKPSAKGMELQAEKGRKPSTKKGKLSSSKSSKSRNKNGDGIDTNGTLLDEYTEDDVTDDYL